MLTSAPNYEFLQAIIFILYAISTFTYYSYKVVDNESKITVVKRIIVQENIKNIY